MSALHRSTPAELKERLAAERRGVPFIDFRDEEGRQHIVVLEGERVTVGRVAGTDVCLDWDSEVSRLHAELIPVNDDWTVVDDGLSRNGTFLNGERLQGRKRLEDGDEIKVGATLISFNALGSEHAGETSLAGEHVESASLSPTQRKVLVALCRPFAAGNEHATPATNKQIAEELFLSVDAVKKQLRTLFDKLGVEDIAQNRKRAALVERAFQTGAVSKRDL